MHALNRSAIVPYTTRQMFELVNDIEEYPRFLPWCHSSRIISRTKEEVTADLEVRWKGIHRSFTTQNVLHPYERMEIILVKGPLQHLEGIWHFQSLNAQACKVLLDLEFEFTGSFIDRLFQPVFQHIANTLVEAFCKRAHDLYYHE
jgi:ribosome-associated toxin RatA of RatAB toxin-antitoxin module